MKPMEKKGIHKNGKCDITIQCACDNPVLLNYNIDAFKETEKSVEIFDEAKNLHRRSNEICSKCEPKDHSKLSFF